MATAWMINDDMKINNINPYVASGTYGIPTDGSKWLSDGTYSIEIDERDTVYTDPNPARDDFNPLTLMLSGPMYLKEVAGKPSAPWGGFPARKYEYDNGSVTWVRPDIAKGRPDWSSAPRAKMWDLWVIVLLLLLAVIVYARMRRQN
jgi:hypothetical protein